jgi:hypothetical protein
MKAIEMLICNSNEFLWDEDVGKFPAIESLRKTVTPDRVYLNLINYLTAYLIK